MAKKKTTASDPANETDSAEIDFEQAVGEVQRIVVVETQVPDVNGPSGKPITTKNWVDCSNPSKSGAPRFSVVKRPAPANRIQPTALNWIRNAAGPHPTLRAPKVTLAAKKEGRGVIHNTALR